MRHIVICGLSGSTIFFFLHYLINGTIFGGNNWLNIKCVLFFSTTFIWNISRSKKNLERDYYKCSYILIQSTRYSFRIVIKPEIFSTYFSKNYSDTKFRENPSNGSRAVSRGRADRHDEAESRFRRFTNAPKQITNKSSLRNCACLCGSTFTGRTARLLTSPSLLPSNKTKLINERL